MKIATFLVLMLILVGCSDQTPTSKQVKGEFIYRQKDEYHFQLSEQKLAQEKTYPWRSHEDDSLLPITKAYFRCKGHILHPVQVQQKGKETLSYYDCGGIEKHSLPLREKKEFIYPILIDLLNYIQTNLKKKVVITSGHCCPDHFIYIDPARSHRPSKHMIGGEVDFYVEGKEYDPQAIVNLILAYYKTNSKYKGLEDFEQFHREKNPSWGMPAWINKEVFVKIVGKGEDRDFDNSHSYPYVNIQVRYDWDTQSNVTYSWDKAFKGYYRK